MCWVLCFHTIFITGLYTKLVYESHQLTGHKFSINIFHRFSLAPTVTISLITLFHNFYINIDFDNFPQTIHIRLLFTRKVTIWLKFSNILL